MKAEDFDKRFDDGESVTDQLDTSRARRPMQDLKRVNVDFPEWMVREGLWLSSLGMILLGLLLVVFFRKKSWL